jgi:hypothetical protein
MKPTLPAVSAALRLCRRSRTLASHPAEEMTRVFLMTPVAIASVPWGYVLVCRMASIRVRGQPE